MSQYGYIYTNGYYDAAYGIQSYFTFDSHYDYRGSSYYNANTGYYNKGYYTSLYYTLRSVYFSTYDVASHSSYGAYQQTYNLQYAFYNQSNSENVDSQSISSYYDNSNYSVSEVSYKNITTAYVDYYGPNGFYYDNVYYKIRVASSNYTNGNYGASYGAVYDAFFSDEPATYTTYIGPIPQ